MNDWLDVEYTNSERKGNQNLHHIFFKIADDEDRFHVQWHEVENEIIWSDTETSQSDHECTKCQSSYNEREEWLCWSICYQCQWYHQDYFYE